MQTILLLALAGGALLLLAAVTHFSGQGSLNNIKSKTVGDGQHGTARWATKKEIRQTYAHVPFRPEEWRKGERLPKKQGLVLGCEGRKDHVIAIVDTDDIHALVTAASGAGKTAYFLYPNIEYALATGMSSARTPRATCFAITRGSPRSAMAFKSPCWICATLPARTAIICST